MTAGAACMAWAANASAGNDWPAAECTSVPLLVRIATMPPTLADSRRDFSDHLRRPMVSMIVARGLVDAVEQMGALEAQSRRQLRLGTVFWPDRACELCRRRQLAQHKGPVSHHLLRSIPTMRARLTGGGAARGRCT